MARRGHGKAQFLDLVDASGRIQLHATADATPGYEEFGDLDLGDLIGVEGEVFQSRRGELSVRVESWQLLAKCLRPLPEKWHGLTDVEQRYRHRYVDLITNEQSRVDAIARSRAVTAMRARAGRGGLRRGGDAGAAAALRRRRGQAVHHPQQRARARPVPADRRRAVPEAADRGRPRPRLRAQQGLPQREHQLQAQPRVHDARVVPGLRRLPRRHGAGREGGVAGRRGCRQHARPDAAVAAAVAARGDHRGGRHRPAGRPRPRPAGLVHAGAGHGHLRRPHLGAGRRPPAVALRRVARDDAAVHHRLPGRAVAVLEALAE